MSADILQFATSLVRAQGAALLEESTERVVKICDKTALALSYAEHIHQARLMQRQMRECQEAADAHLEIADRIKEQMEVA